MYISLTTLSLGSRNRPAWPIQPGMANQTKVIKMELTSGSVEYEEEMIKNRLEVAQVCGTDYILCPD